MIEQLLIQFGALGIVAYVVYDQRRNTNKLLEKLTMALNKVEQIIKKCPHNIK